MALAASEEGAVKRLPNSTNFPFTHVHKNFKLRGGSVDRGNTKGENGALVRTPISSVSTMYARLQRLAAGRAMSLPFYATHGRTVSCVENVGTALFATEIAEATVASGTETQGNGLVWTTEQIRARSRRRTINVPTEEPNGVQRKKYYTHFKRYVWFRPGMTLQPHSITACFLAL